MKFLVIFASSIVCFRVFVLGLSKILAKTNHHCYIQFLPLSSQFIIFSLSFVSFYFMLILSFSWLIFRPCRQVEVFPKRTSSRWVGNTFNNWFWFSSRIAFWQSFQQQKHEQSDRISRIIKETVLFVSHFRNSWTVL